MSGLSQETLRYAVYAVLNVMVARELNTIVTEPYMDEPFHIPQTQAYCRSEWDVWDPKITTPPGLYLFSVALKKVFLFKCTLSVLRFSNVLLSLSLPPLISYVLARFRRDRPPPSVLEPTTESLVISLFPVAWFLTFLYYTETGSLALVLACLLASLYNQHTLAAVLGLASCTFRQTNIIWVVYALGAGALRSLHHPRQPGNSRTPVQILFDPPARSISIFDIIRCIASFPSALWSIKSILIPYTGVLASFVGFVVWNGGIVLGDKSNHIPSIHVPQLYYFIGFSTFMGLPVLFSGPGGPTYLARAVTKRLVGSKRAVLISLVLTSAIATTVHLFTIHHPFVLSDNRHYTFYVWARIFRRSPLINLALSPGYLICFYAWFVRLYCPPPPPPIPATRANGDATGAITPAPRRATQYIPSTKSFLHTLLLPLCLIPTLLPTPLLEPRYFLIPYFLMRLQLDDETAPRGRGSAGEVPWSLVVEGVWYGLINWATMYVFLYRERVGVGRFMW